MYIYWYGESCFKIQNNEITILLDPEAPRKAGLRGPNFSSRNIDLDFNLLLLSCSEEEEEEEVKKRLAKNFFLVAGPGEYEKKNVFIEGISFNEKVIYRIVFEEINFGFLPVSIESLTDEQIEKLGEIDVLLAPAGERIEELINSIEPKIIIPHSYQIPGLKNKRPNKESFLKKLGKKGVQELEKFSFNKKYLFKNPSLEEVIILKAK